MEQYLSLLLLLLSHFSRGQLCATPYTAAHQAPPSLGFSRQEYWRGLPLPSPVPITVWYKCHCYRVAPGTCNPMSEWVAKKNESWWLDARSGCPTPSSVNVYQIPICQARGACGDQPQLHISSRTSELNLHIASIWIEFDVFKWVHVLCFPLLGVKVWIHFSCVLRFLLGAWACSLSPLSTDLWLPEKEPSVVLVNNTVPSLWCLMVYKNA